LLAVYAEARAADRPAPAFAAVAARRRVAFLMRQRESAIGKLIPPGGPR
jgi:hypothetical protein